MLDSAPKTARGANFYPYEQIAPRSILTPMDQKPSREDDVAFVQGCPLCEHADPELEKVFHEFGQWLYGVIAADQRRRDQAARSGGIDNGTSVDTLKERSARLINYDNE